MQGAPIQLVTAGHGAHQIPGAVPLKPIISGIIATASH